MKRSPIKRKTPLRSKTQLKAKAPIKKGGKRKDEATPEESLHMGRVATYGCMVCRQPAEVHHMTGAGTALRSAHYATIPLCPPHHRNGKKFGDCVHNGTKTFEAINGTQMSMLERLWGWLHADYPHIYQSTLGDLV